MPERIVFFTDAGGRGAAYAAAYAPWVDKVGVIPGNDAVRLSVPREKLIDDPHFRDLKTTSKIEILEACDFYGVTLLVVCQDNAVESDLVSNAREHGKKTGLKVAGPTRAAGELESSKIFNRRLGRKLGLNQPSFTEWSSVSDAVSHLQKQDLNTPWVVKADGLCEGKGVIVARNREAAITAVMEMPKFGSSGARFLIEEFLCNDDGTAGQEVSMFFLCQGTDFKFLGAAEDYKRVGIHDKGLNTGGMGGNNKPYFVTPEFQDEVERQHIRPVLEKMVELGRYYSGILYFSGMIINRGGKKVVMKVEDNSRLGDPEAQLILPGIKSNLYEIDMTLAEGGSLIDIDIETDNQERVVVAVCSYGYPENYSAVRGKKVDGIDKLLAMEGVRFFGAGLKFEEDIWKANGGRLLYSLGEDEDFIRARTKAIAGASAISIEGNNVYFRSDISWKKKDEYFRGLRGQGSKRTITQFS